MKLHAARVAVEPLPLPAEMPADLLDLTDHVS